MEHMDIKMLETKNLLEWYFKSFSKRDDSTYNVNEEVAKTTFLINVAGNVKPFTYLEIEASASMFIEKLFSYYVDSDTFVIACIEHPTIEKCLSTINNKFIITSETIKNLDVNTIITAYKNSGCKKIFGYLTSTLNYQIIPQTFYTKLKEKLSEIDIPHTLVLDDVQTMFMIPKNYDSFDHVIFSMHALVQGMNKGVLLSKENLSFGHEDLFILKVFTEHLHTILENKDRLLLFNTMLTQYFSEELVYTALFDTPKNTLSYNFYLIVKDNKVKRVLDKYKDELYKYGIEIGDRGVTIRSASTIMHYGAGWVIEGLDKLKSALQKGIQIYNRVI